MSDQFDEQVEGLLPCRQQGCWQHHGTGCPAYHRFAVAAALRELGQVIEQQRTRGDDYKRQWLKTGQELVHWQNRASEQDKKLAEAQAEVAQLRQVADENYWSLIDHLQTLLQPGDSIGREELLAYLGSRIVHRPQAALRTQLAEARELLVRTHWCRDEASCEVCRWLAANREKK